VRVEETVGYSDDGQLPNWEVEDGEGRVVGCRGVPVRGLLWTGCVRVSLTGAAELACSSDRAGPP